jgi:outer membrane protein assembly factor BamB
MDHNINESISPVSPAPSATASPPEPTATKASPAEHRLRLWPGVAIIALLWLVITAVNWLFPVTFFAFMTMFIAPMVATLALIVWWLSFSRLSWTDRIVCLSACIVYAGVAFAFKHSSFGIHAIFIYAVPTVLTAWVLWLLLSYFLPWPVRRAGLLIVLILVLGYFTLLRFDGLWGNITATLNYRWKHTEEDKYLAELKAGTLGVARGNSSAKALTLQSGDWSGFRGPNRDGHLPGVRIATDWDKNPPKLLWKHRVGPGWGSFAVIGGHIFTQEQRGEDEAVVCYDADTGSEIWSHRDKARFDEQAAGPGPRATPTFHEGNLYTLGAAGKLNCLDASTGRALWTRDIVADSNAEVPQWGFASSPFVTQGIVTVFAGAPNGKSVLGYKADTGNLAWHAGEGQLGYCSPQPARLGGIDQLVIATDKGLTAFRPKSGEVMWKHDWELNQMARVVQPAILNDADVLLGTGFGKGTRRIHTERNGDKWTAEEGWTSRAIAPYFNDLVVHRGHLYGFDGSFFTCVNLENGKSKWRARGYDNGQVLLLEDQDLLLIVSEEGAVALVDAKPDAYNELGRFEALKDKTWNHPVIAHGKLFVRNGVEAACYQLTEIKEQSK